jgi:hypothetical protein
LAKHLLCLGFLAVFLLFGASSVPATTVTLVPTNDTTLFQTAPDFNLGGLTNMVSGSTSTGQTNRALLKFDIVGNIPTNATILSAMVTLTVVRTMAFQANSFSLHRVLQDWGEGTGGATGFGNFGAQAQLGEATWNARFYSNVLWSVPGAAAPGDFVEQASATQSIGGGNGSFTFDTSAGLVADVQSWLTDSTNNFGWILVCDDEAAVQTARRFASREDQAMAPQLTVEYTLVPPLKIAQAAFSGNGFSFSFTAQAGQAYFVQSTDSLASGNWLTFTNIPAPASTQTVLITDPVNGPQRFYRVGFQ